MSKNVSKKNFEKLKQYFLKQGVNIESNISKDKKQCNKSSANR